MPGLRFKLWPVYTVTRHPMVQIPAGLVGVVIAQVGAALPIGAKSAAYKPAFGNFQDLEAFVDRWRREGRAAPGAAARHRRADPSGRLHGDHAGRVLRRADRRDLRPGRRQGALKPQNFGLIPQLEVVRIEPQVREDGKIADMVGIVTTLEGTPLPKGAIANRLGDFEDLAALEDKPGVTDAELVETLLSVKNDVHNNYQDFQAFLDNGGRIGLQHDPLLYGAYNLNPFLVAVEMMPCWSSSRARSR